MKQSSTVVNILIASAITLASFAAFVFLYLDTRTEPLEMQERAKGQVAQNPVVRDFISLLDRVRDIRIPTQVFETNAYKSLFDHARPIPLEPAGRVDPFARVLEISTEE